MDTSRKNGVVFAVCLLCVAFGSSSIVLADNVPLSSVASPEIYKVLAENDLFRVVLATWQPGQRDAYHSHPANVAYRLTDCKNRVYGPGNKVTREASEFKAGTVALQAPIESHSLENTGTAACQVLIVERK